jgi:hypothetical protein
MKRSLLPIFALLAIRSVWPDEANGPDPSLKIAPDTAMTIQKPAGTFFSLSPNFVHRTRFGDHEIEYDNFGTVSAQGFSLQALYTLGAFEVMGFEMSVIGDNFNDTASIDGIIFGYGIGLVYYRKLFSDQNAGPMPGIKVGWWIDGYTFQNARWQWNAWNYFRNIYFGGPCLKINLGFFRLSLQGEISLMLGIRQHVRQTDQSLCWEKEFIKTSFTSCLDFSIGLRYQSAKRNAEPVLEKASCHNAVILDLLGPGGFWALHYERRIVNDVTARAGFSYWKTSDFYGSTRYFMIPYSISYFIGTAQHKLEIGIGSRLFFSSWEESANGYASSISYSYSRYAELIPQVGYRYASDPIIFRLYYSPLISKYASSGDCSNGPGFPWIGASIGYAF